MADEIKDAEFNIESVDIPKSSKKTFTVAKNDTIQSALSQLVNINEDNIYHEPTCLICGSIKRKEIEALWIQTKDYANVKQYAQDQSDLRISDPIIDNHMLLHYSDGIREIQKVEYINKIKRVNEVNLTTLDKINFAFAALTERLSSINSMVPDPNNSRVEIEKIKSGETVKLMNAMAQLLKLQASMLGELKNNGELIILPRDPFINLFNETIAEANTSDQKEIVKIILNKLLNLSKIAQ